MMEYRQALGLAIREVRKKRGMTITDLHYMIRLTNQAIAEIEYGRVSARVDTIVTICQALEIKLVDLEIGGLREFRRGILHLEASSTSFGGWPASSW